MAAFRAATTVGGYYANVVFVRRSLFLNSDREEPVRGFNRPLGAIVSRLFKQRLTE